jgi:hypothetical protein
MAEVCSNCAARLGFLSRKYHDRTADGTDRILCSQCWGAVEPDWRAAVVPFTLANGYTRVEARVFLSNWHVAPLCVACGWAGEAGSTKALQLSNGTISLTVNLLLCARCTSLRLDATEYIRYALKASDLTLDVGNPALAERYVDFLKQDLEATRRVLLSQSGQVDAAVGGATMKLPAGFLHPAAREPGVTSVTRHAAD